MFQYNYRIIDRYKVPVASIAVFTGRKTQVRPTAYTDELLGTVLSFKYTAYHIFDHDEQALLQNSNPFSLIVLACQKALLERKLLDKELDAQRWVIINNLLIRGYSKQRIISFLVFLKNFIYIDNKEINRIFDQKILELTGGTINMGIIETLKMQERREGKMEGRHEEALEIAREMKKDKFPIETISKLTKLSIDEIKAL